MTLLLSASSFAELSPIAICKDVHKYKFINCLLLRSRVTVAMFENAIFGEAAGSSGEVIGHVTKMSPSRLFISSVVACLVVMFLLYLR